MNNTSTQLSPLLILLHNHSRADNVELCRLSLFPNFWAATTGSSSVLLYVHRGHKDYQDGHLHFHTAPGLCATGILMLLYVHIGHKDYEGRGARDGHLHFHTAPGLCATGILMLLYVHIGHKDYEERGARDGHLHFHTAPCILMSLCVHRDHKDYQGRGPHSCTAALHDWYKETRTCI